MATKVHIAPKEKVVVKNKLSFVAGALLALGLSGQALAQTKIEVGVTWAGKSTATTRLYTSMKDRLQEIAPQISLEYAGEQPDIGKVEEIIKNFDSTKAATVALRDSAATLLSKLKTNNPTFVGGTNNPKFYGTINNLQAPEGKITGVSYFIPQGSPHFRAVHPRALCRSIAQQRQLCRAI
jgi:putative ABC transport system substrate-binding protein